MIEGELQRERTHREPPCITGIVAAGDSEGDVEEACEHGAVDGVGSQAPQVMGLDLG